MVFILYFITNTLKFLLSLCIYDFCPDQSHCFLQSLEMFQLSLILTVPEYYRDVVALSRDVVGLNNDVNVL